MAAILFNESRGVAKSFTAAASFLPVRSPSGISPSLKNAKFAAPIFCLKNHPKSKVLISPAMTRIAGLLRKRSVICVDIIQLKCFKTTIHRHLGHNQL